MNWWIIGILIWVFLGIWLLLLVIGGTSPEGAEQDERDDYLSFVECMKNNTTSGSVVIGNENTEK
jgi:hypothetical protein